MKKHQIVAAMGTLTLVANLLLPSMALGANQTGDVTMSNKTNFRKAVKRNKVAGKMFGATFNVSGASDPEAYKSFQNNCAHNETKFALRSDGCAILVCNCCSKVTARFGQ